MMHFGNGDKPNIFCIWK